MVVMDLEDWDMVDMVLEDMDYGKDLQMLSLTTLLTRDLLMQMQVLDLVLVDLVWVDMVLEDMAMVMVLVMVLDMEDYMAVVFLEVSGKHVPCNNCH